MKKYIKPNQKVFSVSTCNNILLTGSPSDPIEMGGNGEEAIDKIETKGEKAGTGIWDLY